ncbi:MAG: hypothetical protein N2067_03085 [Spirochaetaceae bacterium]|nr:hypothetical protein [Spirochaetaceae bacterium]
MDIRRRCAVMTAVVVLPFSLVASAHAQHDIAPVSTGSEPLPTPQWQGSSKGMQDSLLRSKLHAAMLTALTMEQQAVRARIAALSPVRESRDAEAHHQLAALLAELETARLSIAAMKPSDFVPPQRRTIRQRLHEPLGIGSLIRPQHFRPSDTMFTVAGIDPSLSSLTDASTPMELTLYLLLPKHSQGPDAHAWYVYVMPTPPPGPGFSAPDQAAGSAPAP